MKFDDKNTYLKRITLHDKDYGDNYDVFDLRVGKLTIRLSEADGNYLKKYFGVKEY